MRNIHPIQPIAVIVLIGVLLYFRWRKKQQAEAGQTQPLETAPRPRPAVAKPAKPEEPPEVVYDRLRRQALATSVVSVGISGIKEDQPYGFLMEMGMTDSVITLACFADGDAGLYYQSGGGMIGGASHENVREAAKKFLAQGEQVLSKMRPTTEHPLPKEGKVRFYALTLKGILTVEVERESLEESGFSPLFTSGQEVVAQMRKVQEQRGR